jgi:hypothetical protein
MLSLPKKGCCRRGLPVRLLPAAAASEASSQMDGIDSCAVTSAIVRLSPGAALLVSDSSRSSMQYWQYAASRAGKVGSARGEGRRICGQGGGCGRPWQRHGSAPPPAKVHGCTGGHLDGSIPPTGGWGRARRDADPAAATVLATPRVNARWWSVGVQSSGGPTRSDGGEPAPACCCCSFCDGSPFTAAALQVH